MFRKAFVSVVVLALLSAGLLAGSRKQQDPAFAQIDAIVKTLSEITGLTEDHPVPYGRMNKNELRKFLNKRIKKDAEARRNLRRRAFAEDVRTRAPGL